MTEYACTGCGARLDVEPCVCPIGEDWGNRPEASEYMADGNVWR